MSADGTEPVTHVLLHLREQLATDGRVGELGLDVAEEGQAGSAPVVVVRGAVSTEERKDGVVPLATEVLRAHGLPHEVRDETSVSTPSPPAAGDGELL